MCCIPSPEVLGSKSLGGSKDDLASHLSEVDQGNTRKSLGPSPEILGSKSHVGSKDDLAPHLSEVDQGNTRKSWGVSGENFLAVALQSWSS